MNRIRYAFNVHWVVHVSVPLVCIFVMEMDGFVHQNCRAQTLLILEVLYIYCSLWACNFFLHIADVALPLFFSTLVSAK